jgi:hypothetical protein
MTVKCITSRAYKSAYYASIKEGMNEDEAREAARHAYKRALEMM